MRNHTRALPLLIILVVVLPSHAAGPGSLTASLVGFVSNAAGVPQMGARVWLYNAYDQLVGHTLSNQYGAFAFENFPPGRYSLKVQLASYVPAIKRHIELQPGMRVFVSVSLASVFSSIELLRRVPASGSLMSDDWKWVLRTALSTRPVLRFGPEAGDKAGQAKLAGLPPTPATSGTRALVRISAGDGGAVSIGSTQSDLATGFALATSLAGAYRLQLSGTLGYVTAAGIPTAGFRTSWGRSTDVALVPEVSVTLRQAQLAPRAMATVLGFASEGPPLRVATVSTVDQLELAGRVKLEYGASLESVSFVDRLYSVSPFVRATTPASRWGNLQVAFSSGAPPLELLSDDAARSADLTSDLNVVASFPRVSLEAGHVRVQRTQNFEVTYRKVVGEHEVGVTVYRESVANATSLILDGSHILPASDVLPDLGSQGSVFNLGHYRRSGYMISTRRRAGENWSFGVAAGRTGVLVPRQELVQPHQPAQLRGVMRSGRRFWLAMEASGVIPRSGTRVSAHYQVADGRAYAPDHLYVTHTFQPFLGLNLSFRQPLPAPGFWAGRLEASAELRNLLAQGYIPLTTSDGRKFYLIPTPRTVRGGLSFIF